jgi:hypothetical protein
MTAICGMLDRAEQRVSGIAASDHHHRSQIFGWCEIVGNAFRDPKQHLIATSSAQRLSQDLICLCVVHSRGSLCLVAFGCRIED